MEALVVRILLVEDAAASFVLCWGRCLSSVLLASRPLTYEIWMTVIFNIYIIVVIIYFKIGELRRFHCYIHIYT